MAAATYWSHTFFDFLLGAAFVAAVIYLFKLRPRVSTVANTAKQAEEQALHLAELNRALEKRIEDRSRELELAENKFRNTFEKAAVGMAHVGLDGKWLLVNPRICEITGYPEEELLTKTFTDITHPDDLDKDWDLAKKLMRDEIPSYEMEKRYVKKDKSVIWVKLSAAISRSPKGDPEFFISSVTDISAERAAREQIELEKNKIIDLFEQVPTPIAIYEGAEHRITMANPEYRLQTGRDQLVGKTYAEAFPFAKEQGITDLLAEVYRGGKTWNASEFPVRIDMPDGSVSERYINATLQPYRGEDGKVAGLINLSYDVTEQVQARKRLEESEQRLQIAVRAANMGVWEWDIRTNGVKWDTHMIKIFGGPGATFSGGTDEYTNRIHPDDREQVWSTINAALENRKEFEVEHRVVWDDGSIHWILGRGGATYDEQDKPVKLLGVALDIDERKEAEEAIKSSEERFRTLFEQSPLSIEIHSPDGALVKVNEAWRKLWNIPKDHVAEVLRTYNVLKDPALEKKGISKFIQSGFNGIFSKTPPVLYDPADVGVTGRPRWIETYISPIMNIDGSLREVAIVHEDITDRKEAEEAIRAAKDAAETASDAKTQFLANMSHEIRTPLGAMLGFAQLMLEDDQASDAQKNSLKTIVRNGDQLYRIINELLDISKVEANKFEIEKSRFDLEEVIRDITSLLSVKAEQKGIEFNVSSEGPLPETVNTDPVRFRQILTNVIGNAIKFTEKGKVEVVFKLRDHESRDGSSCLECKVVDTGIGIPKDKISKLFHPFTQADQATTRKFGGTGLGLYLSRKFAQALGGDIRLVDCEEEKGCTFLVVVDIGHLERRPLMNFSSVSGEHVVKGTFTQAPLERLHDVRVLVVDDSPDNLELTKRFLSASGAYVETALGAKKAFGRLAEEEFDVIVMDIQMPEIDGYEAVRQLRQRGYEKPIVALTAHAMKGERERCLSAGFDGYLVKPINRPVLVREIKAQSERVAT